MPTNQEADATYQKAVAALHSVVAGPGSTQAQRQRATEKRDMLTMDFIDQAMAGIEERTAKFRTFLGAGPGRSFRRLPQRAIHSCTNRPGSVHSCAEKYN